MSQATLKLAVVTWPAEGKTKIAFDEGYGWKPGYLRPNADLKIGQNASVSSSNQKLLTFFGFQKPQNRSGKFFQGLQKLQ